MRAFSFSCFLLLPFLCFSQVKISGTVTDSISHLLSYANIEVLKGEDVITYAVSDESGKYELSLSAPGNYVFKVSCIGYKTRSYQKEIKNDALLDFTLSEDTHALNEVVIEQEIPDARSKGDTIKYNLKKIITGSEQTLKDILNKLPGIEIDERGKIKASGKTIDNLLVNGKELFGDQHQLITENMSAEMIGGVELIKNFKAFSDLENAGQTAKTALNIDVKKDYQGKIGGDFQLQGGYENRYLAHTNVYKFDKKIDWFFIGDINNLGRQAFTLEDYIGFKGSVDKLLNDDSKTGVISGNDLPSFLFSENDVKSRKPQFSALNFSANPTDKLRIHAFSILSQLRQRAIEEKVSTFFTSAAPIVYNEKIAKKDRFFLNNTFLEATYKPSEKAIFNYTATYTPSNNRLSRKVENNTALTNELKRQKQGTLENFLEYKQQIGKYSRFSLNFFHTIAKKDQAITIDSDKMFLDTPMVNDRFNINQDDQLCRIRYGVQAKYSQRVWKKAFLDVGYRLLKNKNDYKSTTSNALIGDNDIKIDRDEQIFTIGVHKKNRTLLNYNFGLSYRTINTRKPDSETAYNFLPQAKIRFSFSSSHTLTLFYNHDSRFAEANNLIENKVISNYRNVFVNQAVRPQSLSKFNRVGLQYIYYDLFSQTLLSVIGNYDKNNEVVSLNSESKAGYVINRYIISPEETNAHLLMMLDKKIPKLPFSIRLNTAYVFAKRMNEIKASSNEIVSKTVSGSVRISSRFKKSKINFETGIKISNNHISYQINNATNNLINANPFLNLNGRHKNIVWKIDFLVENYQSQNLQTTNYILSPKIVFKKPKAKWEFSLSGNNILQINNTQRVETNRTDNFFEERTFATLPGSILFGIKYKM